MELFSNKKPIVQKTRAPKTARVENPPAGGPEDGRLERILLAPWLSEKALIATEQGVYIFSVPREATKQEVAAAVKHLYKVTPKKVTMVNLPGKSVSLRNRRGVGTRARRHKAYVHLKKGDTIQFA